MNSAPIPNIAPWLAVTDAAKAVAYYQAAFGASELYRLDGDGGSVEVAQLSIGGALFWVQNDPDNSPAVRGAGSVRMILSVDDPDAMFNQAVAAGAGSVAPHPRRVRLADRPHHRPVRP